TSYFNNYFRVLGGSLAQSANISMFTDEERVPQLASIAKEDIVDFYHKTHTSKNLRFIIAGPIYGKKGKMLQILRQGLKPLAKGERFSLPAETPKLVNQSVYLERPDVKKLHFYLDTYVPQRLDEKQTEAME